MVALGIVAALVVIAPADPGGVGADPARVRARRRLPARPADRAEGPGPALPDPDRRPDGPRRPADGDAERAAAGGHHQGQRHRPGQRRRLLPRPRSRPGDHRGRELPRRHLADRADDAALGPRQGRARLAARPSASGSTQELQTIIDEQTEPWGIKVSTVEVKDVELPQDMQRAIALQAQAERERRAKIIGSEGEYQAAQKLADAADIISQNPATLQLRYLQTLLQIGVNNTTIVFPLPIDLMDAFKRIADGRPIVADAPEGPRPEVTPEPGDPEPPVPPPPPESADLSAGAARQRGRRRAARGPDRPADRPAGAARARPPRPPARVRRGRGRAARRRRRDLPVLRGPRGPDPARGLGEPARRRRAPTTPAGCSARSRTSTRS